MSGPLCTAQRPDIFLSSPSASSPHIARFIIFYCTSFASVIYFHEYCCVLSSAAGRAPSRHSFSYTGDIYNLFNFKFYRGTGPLNC